MNHACQGSVCIVTIEQYSSSLTHIVLSKEVYFYVLQSVNVASLQIYKSKYIP